ncbi:MAG TPA: hypothetical protein VM261_22815 [Kofleriaceae bacterium]|nr:hypothetical protein [Kofleriaceae bacterium]
MRRLLLPSLLAFAAACDDDGKPHAPATHATPAPAEPQPTPTAPEVRHAPGPAYIAVDDVGLFRLENGTLTLLVEHPYTFHSIVVDAKGIVYASAIGGMWRLEGTRKNRLDDDRGMPAESLALGPDGVLWASDRRSIHRWDGTWSTEPAATFDNALIQDVAVDLDGRVWVATTAALWRLDGERWSKLDPSFTGSDQPFFGSLEVAADGAVYVSALYGTFVFRDGRWSDTQLSSVSRPIDELAAGPAGHIVGTGGVGGLAVAAPGQPTWKSDISDSAKAGRADVRAVDAGGRSWITTDNGLVILDGRGELVQQWLPGTVAGIDGTVTAIAVVDDGPTLPELRAAATGTITGRVLRGGKPVARAAVELCDMPLITFQTTPCAGAIFTRTATTDARGTFQLTDIPVGSFSFAVKPDARWRVMLGSSNCCTKLTAGGSFDVGAITID